MEAVGRRLMGPSVSARLEGPWGIAVGVVLSVGAGFVFFELVEAPFAALARRIEYRA